MKKIIALLAALAMVLAAAAAPAEEENAAGDALLVTVNGKEIRENSPEVHFWMEDIRNYYGLDEAAAEEYKDLLQRIAIEQVLQYAVADTVLAQKGDGVTDEAVRAELQNLWNTTVESAVTGVTETSTEEEKEAARKAAQETVEANTGYTAESLLEDADMLYATRINLMTAALDKYLSAEDLAVTDEDVEAYHQAMAEQDRKQIEQYAAMYGMDPVEMYNFYSYVAGRASYYIPEGFRGISHILLEVDEELMNAYNDLVARLEAQAAADGQGEDAEAAADAEAAPEAEAAADAEAAPEAEAAAEPTAEPVTQEMVDSARQAILDSVQDKIDEISQKLAEGAAFEDLIAEYGIDPGMADEEARKSGYEVHEVNTSYDENFHRAAMALEKVGDVSDPVVSSFGVHILKYLRDIPGGAVAMTEAIRQKMAEGAAAAKRSSAVTKLLSAWTEESTVVWTDAGMAWMTVEQGAEAEDGSETEGAAEPEEANETEAAAEPAEESKTEETAAPEATAEPAA